MDTVDLKKLKDRYIKAGYKKFLKEAALWNEDKDDAIGLPSGEYLYNTFLESMDDLVRSYKNLGKLIDQYESMDENTSSKLALNRCKKNIAESYKTVKEKIMLLAKKID